MVEPTKRQREVLHFIEATRAKTGTSPTLREISDHFGFRSPKAAADHVMALQRKGVLAVVGRKARAIRPISPWEKWLHPVAHVPVYGSIPAGYPQDRAQEPDSCISADIGTLGIRPSAKVFGLRVRGDSMTGKGILDGDFAIIDASRTPRAGNVVAALIDNESTLKTFATEKGKAVLRSENPRYAKLVPAQELVIQGVMVGLIRRCQ